MRVRLYKYHNLSSVQHKLSEKVAEVSLVDRGQKNLIIPKIEAKKLVIHGSFTDLTFIPGSDNLEELVVSYAFFDSIDLSNTKISKLRLVGYGNRWITKLKATENIRSLTIKDSRCDFLPDLGGITELDYLTVDVSSLGTVQRLEKLKVKNLVITKAKYYPFDNLEHPQTIESLDVSGLDICLDDTITGMSNLRRLSLRNTKTADLAGIEKLTNLEIIDLCKTKVTDLSLLKKLPKLTCLFLRSTEADLSTIYGMKTITTLDVSHTSLKDLSFVDHLPNITSLNISHTDITRLDNLVKLPLRRLSASHTKVIDHDPLAFLSEIEKLVLDSCGIKSIGFLEGKSSLTFLSLRDNIITSLESLRSCAGLKCLYIDDNYVCNLGPLGNIPMEMLSYSGNFVFYDECISDKTRHHGRRYFMWLHYRSKQNYRISAINIDDWSITPAYDNVAKKIMDEVEPTEITKAVMARLGSFGKLVENIIKKHRYCFIVYGGIKYMDLFPRVLTLALNHVDTEGIINIMNDELSVNCDRALFYRTINIICPFYSEYAVKFTLRQELDSLVESILYAHGGKSVEETTTRVEEIIQKVLIQD